VNVPLGKPEQETLQLDAVPEEQKRLYRKLEEVYAILKGKASLSFTQEGRDQVDNPLIEPIPPTETSQQEAPAHISTPLSSGNMTVTLRTGKNTISFRSDDIPDPPVISFAKNIPQLDRMWDDASPQWSGTSPLVIQGNHIPVKYWPDVYKYRRSPQWTGIKQRWHQYRVSYLILFKATLLMPYRLRLVHNT
jgi:hypothetical protein